MWSRFDIPADLDTPVSAWLKLRPLRPRFLLESVEGGERLGRWSILGFGDAERIDYRDGAFHLKGGQALPAETGPEIKAAWRTLLSRAPRLSSGGGAGEFAGGLVGVTGFDMVRRFEPLSPRHPGVLEPAVPDGAWFSARSVLVFDHVSRRCAVLCDGSDADRQALRAAVVDCLRHRVPVPARRGAFTPPVASLDEAAYVEGVRKAKASIREGDVYQLVLSSAFSGRHDLDPFEVYRALRLLNPSPYLYFVDLGDLQVAGSSPEALVKLEGGQATLRPIAGTRRRGADSAEDLALERELLADPKERAEHVMLVDLARNDVGRVARPGTIKVDPYAVVERYSHVMHIVSGVQGALREGMDAFDLFAATFPAGTVVGAPKLRAIELLSELEPVPRGLYAGTVGYFGHDGKMDQAIAIRTIQFQGDTYRFQAGAGVVADSVPEAEHREILAKSQAIRSALALAAEGL